jgi:ubiquinone/menaquinone biosynthesis C-methylase UbiE
MKPATSAPLPDYAGELSSFHAAFAPELADVLASLPLPSQAKVVDVGCGDGFYLQMFAERLGEAGTVCGVDTNAAFLQLADERLARRRSGCGARLIQASLFDDAIPLDAFDLVWCAQSLYSFPEPTEAVRRLARFARRGGTVAVLENDTLHQLLLPWPGDLEIAIRTAELAALEAQSRHPDKFYIGRRLPSVLAETGLEDLRFKTHAIDRAFPLSAGLEKFLAAYLERLAERTEPYLDERVRERFASYVRPDGERYLLRHPQFTMTWINVVALGRRP